MVTLHVIRARSIASRQLVAVLKLSNNVVGSQDTRDLPTAPFTRFARLAELRTNSTLLRDAHAPANMHKAYLRACFRTLRRGDHTNSGVRYSFLLALANHELSFAGYTLCYDGGGGLAQAQP